MNELPKVIERLTDQQAVAAATHLPHTNIEAAPGSGKTFVAAMRFGGLRFAADRDARAVVAVSFTKAATSELRGRVQRIWGARATEWPHRVTTLDGILRDLLEQLLADGLLYWPGGHKQIRVIETWSGMIAHTWTTRQPALVVVDRQIQPRVQYAAKSASHPVFEPYFAAIQDGIATHDDVRRVLDGALEDEAIFRALRDRMSAAWRALIVDEVYDANRLDLRLIGIAASTGSTSVTLVGDPWQALYMFRNANPEIVPQLVEGFAFETLPLDRSFRFRSEQMKDVARRLRDGEGVELDIGLERPDIVIGMRWKQLWSMAPSSVLPLSFGSPSSTPKAAANLMLDYYTTLRLGRRAVYVTESIRALNLETSGVSARTQELIKQLLVELGSDLDASVVDSKKIAKRVWEQLRFALTQAGAQIPAMHGSQVTRFVQLRSRLLSPEGDVAAGITVHQAKGREWDAVHLVLTDDDYARMTSGLDKDIEGDREIYVAATRARDRLALSG